MPAKAVGALLVLLSVTVMWYYSARCQDQSGRMIFGGRGCILTTFSLVVGAIGLNILLGG